LAFKIKFLSNLCLKKNFNLLIRFITILKV